MVELQVLEIKLSGAETPEWVQHILTSCGCVEVQKFSKFLSGVAQLYRTCVAECPHWCVTATATFLSPRPTPYLTHASAKGVRYSSLSHA
jgi:SPX domain protein involved in polyphosphate accumulation